MVLAIHATLHDIVQAQAYHLKYPAEQCVIRASMHKRTTTVHSGALHDPATLI